MPLPENWVDDLPGPWAIVKGAVYNDTEGVERWEKNGEPMPPSAGSQAFYPGEVANDPDVPHGDYLLISLTDDPTGDTTLLPSWYNQIFTNTQGRIIYPEKTNAFDKIDQLTVVVATGTSAEQNNQAFEQAIVQYNVDFDPDLPLYDAGAWAGKASLDAALADLPEGSLYRLLGFEPSFGLNPARMAG